MFIFVCGRLDELNDDDDDVMLIYGSVFIAFIISLYCDVCVPVCAFIHVLVNYIWTGWRIKRVTYMLYIDRVIGQFRKPGSLQCRVGMVNTKHI